MSNVVTRLFTAAALLLLAGCQSSLMVKSGRSIRAAPAGSAQIVFLRPSKFGGGIQSYVYLLDPDQKGQQFIGVVSSGTKLAYTLPPGDYLFMVQGENADFMDAHLAAGKTYYALVSPRFGAVIARFSLLPIHNDPGAKYSIQSDKFAAWKRSCRTVEKSPEADQWYSDNKEVVEGVRDDFLEEWNGRTADDKADLVLYKEDGV